MDFFIKDEDYDVLIRNEISNILLENYTIDKRRSAENMAIDQIKNYLAGRYDVGQIFDARDDERNNFIVMIAIDCALYHLYSSLAPNKIPEHRAQRYGDALDWLKMMLKGDSTADLPRITDPSGQVKENIRISSKYKADENKW